jgi:hypothetical protein
LAVRVDGQTLEPGQIGLEFEEAKSNYIRGFACDPKYAAGEIVRHLFSRESAKSGVRPIRGIVNSSDVGGVARGVGDPL